MPSIGDAVPLRSWDTKISSSKLKQSQPFSDDGAPCLGPGQRVATGNKTCDRFG